ncbi:ABC transporter ATP-binding protein [Nitrincola tapanii]|uniref:ABC transporter ATP-binding protein n=1 Tax=Nitrincola tapanii TaxID=1708751 RepID=A0A5A9W635_9GAMM|nr:ABC transporter ATP-binding protein [Nitrincola tapanii]KAA0876186.1 ABC transporter ATP-binding protein [Nitrincola tapanii]
MSFLEPGSDLLIAENLSKSFQAQGQDLHLFSNLQLKIQAGDSLAIIGRSGAGKSTLLSLLAGLDQPTSGRILLNGQDLTSLDDTTRAELRSRHLSFIFQSFHLLPELTALDNVRLPLEIRGDAQADQLARLWLKNVGLASRMQHLPSQLSGGEQQRVAIARAFVTSPALLFADEPTGNLDENTGREITDQLFRLNQETGTTLVLITHDKELAQRCQRCLTLHQGQLLEGVI